MADTITYYGIAPDVGAVEHGPISIDSATIVYRGSSSDIGAFEFTPFPPPPDVIEFIGAVVDMGAVESTGLPDNTYSPSAELTYLGVAPDIGAVEYDPPPVSEEQYGNPARTYGRRSLRGVARRARLRWG